MVLSAMHSSDLFYVFLALLLFGHTVFSFVLGSGFMGGKPMLPTDETPDLSGNQLSLLTLPQIFIFAWLFPLLTGMVSGSGDSLVIFGSLLAIILALGALLRFFRNQKIFIFPPPRKGYAKAFTAATGGTVLILLLNWALAEAAGTSASPLIESTYGSNRTSGVRFSLPVRSPFPWEDPYSCSCHFPPDQVARVKLGTDRVKVIYFKGALGLPLLKNCTLEN